MKINELEALRKRNLFQIESKFSKRLVREKCEFNSDAVFSDIFVKVDFHAIFTRLAIKVPLTSQDALYGSFTVQFYRGNTAQLLSQYSFSGVCQFWIQSGFLDAILLFP